MQKMIASLGPVCGVIGAQWGDEGKGKIIDILAEHFDVVARACGGANAGHTIVVGGKKHVFHLLPAGSLHAGKPVVLGAGMVIHLPTLLEEIATLKDSGIDIVSRLHLSPAAHIVFEYHKDIDAVMEERRTKQKGQGIGTTKRGIGPAYMDKAARSGMRLESLRSSEKDLKKELTERATMAEEMFGVKADVTKELSELLRAKKLLESRVSENTVALMGDLLQKKKTILIEGAQATLLDLDHGTYPYVTSSYTTAAGALQGLGLAPKVLSSCIGVAKAYCTRVGSGRFPTEVTGTTGDRLRERGGEYGATTGRPRRCGWLSIPDIQFAAALNGFDHWNITKLDVLDEEEVVPVGIAMKNGKMIYKEFPGWKESTAGVTSFADLPKNAQAFIRFVEKETGIPASFIGTGQAREAMIVRS
ncbi:adenylosuccinate synthase [Candidatus Peregrinibacteria bacterium]|nr:adenylosuccinate synthase [Candidatus Peregrinibacteria bacterium]